MESSSETALIETGAEVVRELDDPNGFWMATISRRGRIMKASLWFLAPVLAETFRRTPRSVGTETLCAAGWGTGIPHYPLHKPLLGGTSR